MGRNPRQGSAVCPASGSVQPALYQASGEHLWRRQARHTPRLPALAAPKELLTLNPASSHFSVSHSKLGAFPGPLPLSLFFPPFPTPPFTSHKLFLRLELFIPTSLTLTHSLARGDTSAASAGHRTAQRCQDPRPGLASPSSPEGCSSERGKRPLSLERAELLQEKGNLAWNLCPEARPGRGGGRGRGTQFSQQGLWSLEDLGSQKGDAGWSEATSQLDLPSEANRAFSLLSPKT